ncbi:unnamed protein product [Rhizophagus irregularis]|nr:unnamed protein product [Rhizophagus irregularis]
MVVINKIIDFIKENPVEYITAASIIYKIMENNPTIQKVELLELLNEIIQNVKNNIDDDSDLFKKLSDIPNQFNIALESIYSLHNIKALKMNDNISYNKNMINENIEYIKSQLSIDSSSLSISLLQNINNIDSNNLTWKNPLANGIISDNDTSILNNDKLCKQFNKPINNMIIKLSESIKKQCHDFVLNYKEDKKNDIADLYKKFTHNKQWIENNEELEKITTNILNVIENNWSNSAFTSEFAKEQSEGTYVADIIIPSIQAALKGLPFQQSYISTAERQSIASADRIKEGSGKRPDFMYIVKLDGKTFELIFGECSRIYCDDNKKRDDEIKLWREANDGKEIYLNALMTDKQNINRYYHLQKTEVPVQKTEKSIKVLPKFVKLLLNLRNILMINLSLLTNAPKVYTRRTKSSSTISSPKRDEDKQKKINKRKQKK